MFTINGQLQTAYVDQASPELVTTLTQPLPDPYCSLP